MLYEVITGFSIPKQPACVARSDQALAVAAEPEGSVLVGLNCGDVARMHGDSSHFV